MTQEVKIQEYGPPRTDIPQLTRMVRRALERCPVGFNPLGWKCAIVTWYVTACTWSDSTAARMDAAKTGTLEQETERLILKARNDVTLLGVYMLEVYRAAALLETNLEDNKEEPDDGED